MTTFGPCDFAKADPYAEATLGIEQFGAYNTSASSCRTLVASAVVRGPRSLPELSTVCCRGRCASCAEAFCACPHAGQRWSLGSGGQFPKNVQLFADTIFGFGGCLTKTDYLTRHSLFLASLGHWVDNSRTPFRSLCTTSSICLRLFNPLLVLQGICHLCLFSWDVFAKLEHHNLSGLCGWIWLLHLQHLWKWWGGELVVFPLSRRGKLSFGRMSTSGFRSGCSTTNTSL